MLVQPYSALRVAYTDELELETEAAPDRALLAEPEARSVFRRLPLARRMKTYVKMCLPQTWYRRVKRLAGKS